MLKMDLDFWDCLEEKQDLSQGQDSLTYSSLPIT